MKPLRDNEEFNRLLGCMNKGQYPLSAYGLSESGKSYLINGIFENRENSIVIVTHSDIEAKNLYEDLSLYSTDVYYFPVREVVFYNIDAITLNNAVILETTRTNTINNAILLFLFFCF